jgi:hypothetical protein
MLEIESRFLGRQDCSLVTILTEIPRFIFSTLTELILLIGVNVTHEYEDS